MKKKWKTRLLVILISTFLLSLLFLYSLSRMTPTINKLMLSRSETYATTVINSALAETLEESGVLYSDLIRLDRNEEGEIASLSANTVLINRLKSDFSLKISSALSQGSAVTLKIPVGSLTEVSAFSGRGFGVPIKIIVSESVVTGVESDFSAVGINQSWHRISVRVRIRLLATLLTKTIPVEVEESVIIGDTVIVGKIPDAYTALNKLDSDDVDDIVDFGATAKN